VFLDEKSIDPHTSLVMFTNHPETDETLKILVERNHRDHKYDGFYNLENKEHEPVTKHMVDSCLCSSILFDCLDCLHQRQY